MRGPPSIEWHGKDGRTFPTLQDEYTSIRKLKVTGFICNLNINDIELLDADLLSLNCVKEST